MLRADDQSPVDLFTTIEEETACSGTIIGPSFDSYNPTTGWYTVEELGPASILEAVRRRSERGRGAGAHHAPRQLRWGRDVAPIEEK